MGDRSPTQRLSQITTMWTVLARAHDGNADDAAAARQLLVERYGRAVRNYLLAVLGDADAADELTQEFALGLVRGEFRGADPRRGRFRNYVKAVLFHLVGKHRRAARRKPRPMSEYGSDVIDVPAPVDEGSRFDRAWREVLLNRAWRALEQAHPVGYAVLRLRANDPKGTSDSLAERLGRHLGKLVTAAAARQHLHRARERFAHFLIDAVAHSLVAPTADELEDELRELGLLAYCRDALDGYRS